MSYASTDPRRARLPYVPALDGLRGIAVAAVLLFHGGVTQLRGGHLGVSVFFTLSGFLITALLLVERESSGRVALRAFWGRRARRLVPAMVLCLGLVALVLHLSDRALPGGVVGDAVAAVTWVANWRFIAQHQSYADLFAMPSPFQHFWSLAVEEQFYVVFPLLFVGLCGLRSVRARTGRLAAVLLALVVLSTVQAAHLQAAGGGLSRAYYGTDARAAELLVGALLALLLVRADGLRTPEPRLRTALNVGGLVGLVGLGVAFALVTKGDPHLYRGGFLLVALATAAVIGAAVQHRSVVGRLLSLDPLVQLGKISYGVYLFHWPLFLLLTRRFTGYDGLSLLALRIAATLVVARTSYVLFEQPVRHGFVPLREGLVAWVGSATAGVLAVALAAGVLVLPTATPATATAAGPAWPTGAPRTAAGSAAPRPGATSGPQKAARQPTGSAPRVVAQGRAPAHVKRRRAAAPTELAADPKKFTVPPVPDAGPGQLKIAVVGDSVGFNIGRGFLSWQGERTDVVAYNLAIPGCPLSRGGDRRIPPDIPFRIDASCGWWGDASSPRAKALAQFDPDVVVVEDGINEVFDRKLPSWSTWRDPTDPQFDTWLGSELSAMERSWTAAGAKVLLANAPCADWQRYDHFAGMTDADVRVRALNLNVYDIASRVQHADLFNRICPNGQYSDTVEGIPDGRPDGFHFSPEAGAALVRNWLGPLAISTAKSAVPPL